jgi:4-amino-4-deoxy-L-arabinose transferase-like glycosyltransferase
MEVQQGAIHAIAEHPITRTNLYFALLLSAIFVFHGGTLRQGHVWGDDFAMYIHHAKNIVEHRPYAETGYIYNSAVPVYGPRAYPPVFPVLLSPLYRVFGLNLVPMKFEQIFFLLGTLTIVYFLWRQALGSSLALALTAILGFSPALWIAKDEVLSDIPFLFIFYLTAVLVQISKTPGSRWWLWGPAIGISVYSAIGTRSAGVALGAGLLLYDLFRERKITKTTVLALAAAAVFLALQSRFVGPIPGSYLEQIHQITWRTAVQNGAAYARVLVGFWVGGVQNLFSFLVVGFIAIAILTGWLLRRGSGISILESFLTPYLLVIILWPFNAGIRIVYPLIPWLGFLALRGTGQLVSKFTPPYQNVALYGLILAIAINYGEAYHRLDFGPIRESEGNSEFAQLCQTIRERTSPEDTFIYFRARALSLYTDRAASTYNYRGGESAMFQYLKQARPGFLITTTAFHDDGDFLLHFVQKNPESFDLAYRNPSFSLYRIRRPNPAIATLPPENESPSRAFIVK